jgi:hypothetical protein
VGTNAWQGDGTTYAQALQRQNNAYGKLEIVRVFWPGMPAAWPGATGLSGGPVVVSFRPIAKDVLAGKHDAFYKDWFAKAPRDRDIYWSYWHEPENDAGQITAADYRNAFRRLAGLADQAGNSRLKATPILMCWTVDPASGRKFTDWYPGSDVVDVMGWDCYNDGAKKGTYWTPAQTLDLMIKKCASIGKPWGLAEFGSLLVKGDNGTKRAAYLQSVVNHIRKNNGLFVTYFDANHGPARYANNDYRLTDSPSRNAWKWAVSGS